MRLDKESKKSSKKIRKFRTIIWLFEWFSLRRRIRSEQAEGLINNRRMDEITLYVAVAVIFFNFFVVVFGGYLAFQELYVKRGQHTRQRYRHRKKNRNIDTHENWGTWTRGLRSRRGLINQNLCYILHKESQSGWSLGDWHRQTKRHSISADRHIKQTNIQTDTATTDRQTQPRRIEKQKQQRRTGIWVGLKYGGIEVVGRCYIPESHVSNSLCDFVWLCSFVDVNVSVH